MKKFIVFLILTMLTVSAFGSTSAFDIKWWSQQTYSNLPGNTLRLWAEGMDGRVGGGFSFWICLHGHEFERSFSGGCPLRFY